jgi:hypothetical protein
MNVEEELERVADRFCIDVDSIETVWEQLHEAGVCIEDFEVALFTSFVMGHDKKELKRIKRNLGKREYQKLMKETLLHACGR